MSPAGGHVVLIFPARISGHLNSVEEKFLRGNRDSTSVHTVNFHFGSKTSRHDGDLLNERSDMPTRRKRKTIAVQQSAIEMVRGKACIVFERTGEKVCRKTMVCSTPIRVPVLLSSFHPFLPVSPRSRPRLEVLMKT